jgi:hypothetical protein
MIINIEILDQNILYFIIFAAILFLWFLGLVALIIDCCRREHQSANEESGAIFYTTSSERAYTSDFVLHLDFPFFDHSVLIFLSILEHCNYNTRLTNSITDFDYSANCPRKIKDCSR